MYLIVQKHVLTNQIKKKFTAYNIISSTSPYLFSVFAGINSTERIPLHVRKELICYSLK